MFGKATVELVSRSSDDVRVSILCICVGRLMHLGGRRLVRRDLQNISQIDIWRRENLLGRADLAMKARWTTFLVSAAVIGVAVKRILRLSTSTPILLASSVSVMAITSSNMGEVSCMSICIEWMPEAVGAVGSGSGRDERRS